MSFLSRLRPSSLRNLRPRAGDSHKADGFWSEGKNTPGGYLFGETPPPPGQRRKWESWEAPWCAAFLGADCTGMQIAFLMKTCAHMTVACDPVHLVCHRRGVKQRYLPCGALVRCTCWGRVPWEAVCPVKWICAPGCASVGEICCDLLWHQLYKESGDIKLMFRCVPC